MAELGAIAARVLPGSGRLRIERTASGVSTPVYRLQRGGVTRYLRLAETPEQSLAAEALAHTLMRERGVRVPEVIYLEPVNDVLGRAVMVTAEIPGEPLSTSHQGIDAAAVLTAAGRDLAALHQIAVTGFGWVRRDRHEASRLEAAFPTLAEFALDGLEDHLASLTGILENDEITAIENTLAPGVPALAQGRAILVHGDFDASHIYHREGVYTGVIDFGEIRSAIRSTTWGTSRSTTASSCRSRPCPLSSRAISR